jgi:hypothetical protein
MENLFPTPAMSAMTIKLTKTSLTLIPPRTTLGMETAIALRIAALPVRPLAMLMGTLRNKQT